VARPGSASRRASPSCPGSPTRPACSSPAGRRCCALRGAGRTGSGAAGARRVPVRVRAPAEHPAPLRARLVAHGRARRRASRADPRRAGRGAAAAVRRDPQRPVGPAPRALDAAVPSGPPQARGRTRREPRRSAAGRRRLPAGGGRRPPRRARPAPGPGLRAALPGRPHGPALAEAPGPASLVAATPPGRLAGGAAGAPGRGAAATPGLGRGRRGPGDRAFERPAASSQAPPAAPGALRADFIAGFVDRAGP
jgi:hypothetical protein